MTFATTIALNSHTLHDLDIPTVLNDLSEVHSTCCWHDYNTQHQSRNRIHSINKKMESASIPITLAAENVF